MKLTPLSRLAFAVALCLLPVVALLFLRLVQGIDAQTTSHTLAGLPVAFVGGWLAGAVAERLLHRSRNTFQTLAGLALSAGIALLSIGYLNLIHIRGPMSSIGTLSRAVEQVTLFVAFLTAQGAGILLAPVLLPARRDK